MRIYRLPVIGKVIAKAVCSIKGCHYDTPVIDSYSLYFCSRCGREVFDRTFADLAPIPQEEWDARQRFRIANEDY